MIYNEAAPPAGARVIVDPTNTTRRKAIPADATREELLVPVFRHGRCIYAEPTLAAIRDRARDQLGHLYAGTKRLLNPHEYPVGLEPGLFELKMALVFKNRPVAA
jgi:nicotinate phosphoribosyltransferase